MHDLPSKVLRGLIVRRGRELCDDPRRCEALLKDLCGRYRLEISLLVNAQRERVPQQLTAATAGVPQSLLAPRLAQQLEDVLGLAPDKARWAVESWIWILKPPRDKHHSAVALTEADFEAGVRACERVGVIATPIAPTAGFEPIELQRSPVAGFQYHEGKAVWPLLAIGASLDLVREPENPYDGRAVRIDWQGHKLGYVPRIDNAAVCDLLDSGQVVTAEIVGLNESSNPWDCVEVAVFLWA